MEKIEGTPQAFPTTVAEAPKSIAQSMAEFVVGWGGAGALPALANLASADATAKLYDALGGKDGTRVQRAARAQAFLSAGWAGLTYWWTSVVPGLQTADGRPALGKLGEFTEEGRTGLVKYAFGRAFIDLANAFVSRDPKEKWAGAVRRLFSLDAPTASKDGIPTAAEYHHNTFAYDLQFDTTTGKLLENQNELRKKRRAAAEKSSGANALMPGVGGMEVVEMNANDFLNAPPPLLEEPPMPSSDAGSGATNQALQKLLARNSEPGMVYG